MNHPLLTTDPFHNRLLSSASSLLRGSNSDPNSIYPTIYSNFHSGNVSNLIKILNNANLNEVSSVFKLCNGSINIKAIQFFKELINHQNTDVRLAARKFYFKYLKENELQGLNKKNLNSYRLNKVYDLIEKYFTSSSEVERDKFSIEIAQESGIAYDKNGADLVTAVDNSGVGVGAIGSQLNGFIALLRGSNAGTILFDMIHDDQEGFLDRNKNLVPQFVLSGQNSSPALSAHCAGKYIKANQITENIPRSFRGVLYSVQPGQYLAPKLLSSASFNAQTVIDEEIKFLKEAGQLSDTEAKNFNFNFQSLAKDLFSVSNGKERKQAIKNFALAYALLNFRKQKIEASTVSNVSKFSPLGYNLIASDKETALKYAQRQIDLMGQVLSEKFLDDNNMELTFRQVLEDNYSTYLQTMAVSQLSSETSQFEARVRAVSDQFSNHKMGLGAPKMIPIPITTLVALQTLTKTFNKSDRDKLALEIQNKIKEKYGDPLVDLKVINKIFKFDSNTNTYSIKKNSKIDLGRGPNSYNEWNDYISSLSSDANSVLDSFKNKVSRQISSAQFIDEANLSKELELLEQELENFIQDHQKSLNAGSQGAQAAIESKGSPISYNIASKVKDFVSNNPYLNSKWSEIFSGSVDDITFNITNTSRPNADAKGCIEQLKNMRLGLGDRGSQFQKSLETLLVSEKNPFINLIQADSGSLSSEETIIQRLILENRDRDIKAPHIPLEKLLLGSGNAGDPRASDKMLMGLMQLIALGDQDPKAGQAVRKYIGKLLNTNLDSVDISRILGQNATDSFETAVGHITNEGIKSKNVADFHRFAYYDVLSSELSQNLSSFRVDIENKRRSSLSTLLGPLLKILGKEGEHIQVLDKFQKNLEEISTNSMKAYLGDDESRPEVLSKIQNDLSTEFSSILIKSSEAQKDWLKNLSSDYDRLDILSLIIQVCKELFNRAPAPQQLTRSPFSLN